MPTLADLALGAGDLPAVAVDVEVVPGEALVPAVLPGGVAAEWPGDGDLVITRGLFQVNQGGVAAVDQMLGGQQATAAQTGVDAGQDLAVGAVGGTGLGQMSGEPLPSDDVSVARLAGRRVVGRDDRPGRGGSPGPLSSSVRQSKRPAASR